MGRGMAHAFAYTGHTVRVVDLKPRPPEQAAAVLQAAQAEVARTVGVMAEAGALAPERVDGILARISAYAEPDADAALADADVILEGVPEVMDAKQAAFARIGGA